MDTQIPRHERVARRLLPWGSLGVGVASALLMDRGPGRALLVASAAIGCWVTLVIVLWLRRKKEEHATLLWKSAHFTTLMLTQSAMQLSFFFALPFYWKAWGGALDQAVFIGVLTAAAVASLWDPLTEWLFAHPRWAPILPGLATFSALNAVLPGLGASNSKSLWSAAMGTAVALFLLGWLRPRDTTGVDRRRTLWATAVAAAVLPIGLFVGGARAIPAAPLALVDADIGTHQRGRWVADPIERLERKPAVLMCATAIRAPLGVKESLFHVWRQDGEVRDRIELEFSGGREQGYRTWSRKHNFGEDPRGTWSCSVETGLGQVLGKREIVIDPR